MAENKMTVAEVEKLFGKKPGERLSTPEMADDLLRGVLNAETY